MYLLAALLYLWYTNKILLLSCWGCPVPIYSHLYCIRGNPVHGTLLCTDRAGTLADVSQVLHNVSMSPCLIVSLFSLLCCWDGDPLLLITPSSVWAGRGPAGTLWWWRIDVCPAALVLTPLIMSSGQQPGLALHDIHDQTMWMNNFTLRILRITNDKWFNSWKFILKNILQSWKIFN